MAAFARTAGFYALVLFIVVFSVFPFYYAIVTSFKSGTDLFRVCLLYTSPSPRDRQKSRMPSSA